MGPDIRVSTLPVATASVGGASDVFGEHASDGTLDLGWRPKVMPAEVVRQRFVVEAIDRTTIGQTLDEIGASTPAEPAEVLIVVGSPGYRARQRRPQILPRQTGAFGVGDWQEEITNALLIRAEPTEVVFHCCPDRGWQVGSPDRVGRIGHSRLAGRARDRLGDRSHDASGGV